MDTVKVINAKQDSLKITRGQRGSVGYEIKIHFDSLPEELDKAIEQIKKIRARLDTEFGIEEQGI